ncbi:MAG: hypothetical protein E7481_08760 [Ruminococcaceae bacterium]|nr:hypothetical protein [Oscillospiraceae bacterium]
MGKKKKLPDSERFYGFSKDCKDAMFFNPVASANDCTGYTMKAPLTDDETEDKARLVNSPATKYEIEWKN